MLSIKNNYDQIKAAIVPILSIELSLEEIELFKKYQPLGYIIFTRNYNNPSQLKQLVDSLHEISKRDDLLIFIDQEGERVARLRGDGFTVLPNAKSYSIEAEKDLAAAVKNLQKDMMIVGNELINLGINVNCAPVADLHHEKAHEIIGVRSYGSDIHVIKSMCEAVDNGLAEAKVQSVIKHIPGHGRATLDSHIDLPVVDTDLAILEQTDFKIFNLLKDMKMAMTAHVIYSTLDSRPTTLSRQVLDYIRNIIEFKGVIISDALDMKALSGDMANITLESSAAGCDILLYCDQKLYEMEKVLQNAHYISKSVADNILKFNCFV